MKIRAPMIGAKNKENKDRGKQVFKNQHQAAGEIFTPR